MEMDDQNQIADQSPSPHAQARSRGFAVKVIALVVALAGVAGAAGFLMAPLLRQDNDKDQSTSEAAPEGRPLFRDWPKPDVALLLSGEQHGYLQPCGCSAVQLGGLARRYNFLQTLNKRGWTVVAGDVGDVAQESGPETRIKFEYSMKMLGQLGYTAVGIGKNEVNLPLTEGLAETVLNNKEEPRPVVTNLLNRQKDFPEMIEAGAISNAKGNAPVVGFAGIVGPSLAKELKNSGLKFIPEEEVLPQAVQSLRAEKADLLVLLYQGSAEEAKECAKKFPEFQVILHAAKEPEPSSEAIKIGNTMLVNPGHKGRYVSVVGAYRTGNAEQSFNLRYQLVELAPAYETPEGKDNDNPIHALMQEYAQQVKDRSLIRQFLLDNAHPLQVEFPKAEYVGSQVCNRCHKSAFKVWKDHPHSKAYDKLVVKAKRPTLRQFDGECVVCHVTGFGYKTGFRSPEETPKLLHVGCEACHGPGSLHVSDDGNQQIRAAMNPFKARPGEDTKKLENRIFLACVKCHDTDNDTHFDSKSFPDYFKKTYHTVDP